MIKRVFLLLAILSIILSGCASQGQSTDQEKLYIAVTGALTGPSAQDGQEIKRGAELAVDNINANGGINGKQVALVFEDDRSDPKEAANIANKLVNDSRILAVIGHYNSSCTLAGAPIYNKAGLVEISGGSTSPAVSQAGPYTFRVIVTDAEQGDYVTKWMVKELGFKNVVIMYENDDYGAGLKDVIDMKVTEYGGKVLGIESYYLGQTKDFTPYITKLRALNPDALFIAGLYNEAALIAKQAADVGWTPPIFGTDGFYTQALIDMGGKAVEGVRVSGYFFSGNPDPAVQDFVAQIKTKYNVVPGAYTANGYDAMMVLAEAIKKNGADRGKINDYLTTLKGYKGLTGTISFDENGDAMKDPLKLQVVDGQFTIVK